MHTVILWVLLSTTPPHTLGLFPDHSSCAKAKSDYGTGPGPHVPLYCRSQTRIVVVGDR